MPITVSHRSRRCVSAYWKRRPIYGSFAQAFRVIVDSTVNCRAEGGVLPEPSFGTQLEGGLKADLLGGLLGTTVSGFRLTRENTLVANPTDPFGLPIQTGEQTVTGVELSATARPAPGWNAVASVSFMRGEVTEDTSIPIGTRLVNVPSRTVSLWSTYTFSDAPIAGLGVGGGVFHVSDRAANASASFLLPAYTRMDGTMFYERSRWRLALNINNLTNEQYFESGGGFVAAYPAAPRSATLTASVRSW